MKSENYQQTLEKILHNNRGVDAAGIKQVLILHEEELTNIGDWVIRFDKLKYLKAYAENATVTINFTAPDTNRLSGALLKNNPHLDVTTAKQWAEIDFEKYDFIISVSYNEQAILAWLHEKYGSQIQSGAFNIRVFSMSHYMLKPKAGAVQIFPVNQEMAAHAGKVRPAIELFVSNEEREWADNWLREKGIKENEHLYVILDTTTRRDKLLSMPVYFEWLMGILKKENVKVLIYDETNMGKEKFYSELLGAKFMDKFIFSKNPDLRENICLLSSSYTRLVFGPCTGLMHCASSIYNNYVYNGLDKSKVPVIVTYTGKYYPDEKNVKVWWGNAPLVNVLVLRNRNNTKTLLLLDQLSDEEKVTNDELPCAEYTARMISELVNQKLLNRVEQLA